MQDRGEADRGNSMHTIVENAIIAITPPHTATYLNRIPPHNFASKSNSNKTGSLVQGETEMQYHNPK